MRYFQEELLKKDNKIQTMKDIIFGVIVQKTHKKDDEDDLEFYMKNIERVMKKWEEIM